MTGPSQVCAMHPTMLALQRVLGGLTRQQLAVRSGVSEHDITEIEDGREVAHPLIVRKLAAGLKVPLARLFIQPIEPELFRQLLDREITYEQFKQQVYGTPGHDRSCPGCGGLR